MAIDWETIVSLHKKGESNSTIAKELQIRRETVWKVVKKFRETGHTSNRLGQGRKRTVRTKRMVKNTREKLRTNPRRSATKLAAEAGISQTSMRRILKEDLKTFPYKMQKRHELTPTHERMRVERCRHLLNLMKDGMLPNLVFSDKKKFDVEQCVNHQNDGVWDRNAPVEDRRVSRHQNPTSVMVWAEVTATGRSPLVFVPSWVKLNSQRYISDILEGKLLPWAPESTSREHLGPSSKTRRPHMAQEWPNGGFRPTSRRSTAMKIGPQGARIWMLWSFRCGPFSRARLVELLMILSRIWRSNYSGNRPWSPKKFCVPRAMHFKGDWSKLLKIKEAMLNKW